MLQLLDARTGSVISNCNTALHNAIAIDDPYKVRQILESGEVDITTQNHNGETALTWAAKISHASIDCARAILEHLVVEECEKEAEIPPPAIRRPTLEIRRRLLSDVNLISVHFDRMHRSPLHWAAVHNNEPLVKILLEHGININHQDERGETALHMAARQGHLEAVHCLLQFGANKRVVDQNRHMSTNGVRMSTRRQHPVALLHANDLVTLCVSGREFVAMVGMLANSRSGYFEQMFRVEIQSGRIAILMEAVIFDDRGRIFVNRDGDLFAHVLQYLRDGKHMVLPNDTYTLRRLVREAEFFNLPVFRLMLVERLQEEERLRDQRDQHLDSIHNVVQQISQQLYVTNFRK